MALHAQIGFIATNWALTFLHNQLILRNFIYMDAMLELTAIKDDFYDNV